MLGPVFEKVGANQIIRITISGSVKSYAQIYLQTPAE